MISVLDSLEHDAALMQLCSLLYVSVFPPILGYVILVYGILYSFFFFLLLFFSLYSVLSSSISICWQGWTYDSNSIMWKGLTTNLTPCTSLCLPSYKVGCQVNTIHTFSSRKLEIFPPSGWPARENWISKYLPYTYTHTYSKNKQCTNVHDLSYRWMFLEHIWPQWPIYDHHMPATQQSKLRVMEVWVQAVTDKKSLGSSPQVRHHSYYWKWRLCLVSAAVH